MYLIVLDKFSEYFGVFSQYLVMYLVPGVKGLPGVGRFGLSRGPGPSPHVVSLFLYSGKMTFLENFDMYFIIVDTFNQYWNRFI